MPALDLSALSPEVTLLGTTIVAGPRSQLTSTPVTGFSDVASATVVVKVERVDNSNGEALSVTVQGSEDGNSWSTVAGPYSFARDGLELLAVDDPPDRLRVAWSAPRGVREAAIGSVTARLAVVDAPAASPGGSQSVWTGPCKLNAFSGQVIRAQGDGAADVDGGTFTLTHDGTTTSAIPWNASSGGLQAALEELVGAGNARIDNWVDANQDIAVVFKELAATELLTVDGALLTGPSGPYTGYTMGSGSWVSFPLFTVAVGDIIDDFMHSTRVGFDGSDAVLIYTDSLTDPDSSNSPHNKWCMPVSAQGLDGLTLTQAESDYAHFTGSASVNPADKATARTALLAAWAVSAVAGDDPPNTYMNLPAAATAAVPVYAYIKNADPAPTGGEVWIWTKVSTPAEMDA